MGKVESEQMMSSIPPTSALAQFEMHRADPQVQGLQSFIRLVLGKSLGQVLNWDITQYKGVENLAGFKLELLDGSLIEGRLSQQQGRWLVAETDWRYIF